MLLQNQAIYDIMYRQYSTFQRILQMFYEAKNLLKANDIKIEQGKDLSFPMHLHGSFEVIIFTEGEHHHDALENEPQRDSPQNDPKLPLRQRRIRIQRRKRRPDTHWRTSQGRRHST